MTRRGYREVIQVLNRLQYVSTSENQRNALGARRNAREKMQAWIDHLALDVIKPSYIHIAGTKGKGTTCLYTESILSNHFRQHGLNAAIGTLTKPHMESVRERIRINMQPISEEMFSNYFWQLWEQMIIIDRKDTTLSLPRYPGFITLLAFSIFSAEAVRIAIIETGIGGETDSTNVIANPVATGITKLGLDHVDVLGNDIAQIAWHKAGIFKSQAPAFSVTQERKAREKLEERAEEKGILLKFVAGDEVLNSGIVVEPDAPFQRENAALAIKLAEACVNKIASTTQISQTTLRQCLKHTHLPGKFEILRKGRIRFLLCAAHNEMSIRAICGAFNELIKSEPHGQNVLLFGPSRRHAASGLLSLIHDEVRQERPRSFQLAVFCPPCHEEGLEDFIDHRPVSTSPSIFEALWKSLGGICKTAPTVDEAVAYIYSQNKDYTVLVIGSNYTAGIVRHRLRTGVIDLGRHS